MRKSRNLNKLVDVYSNDHSNGMLGEILDSAIIKLLVSDKPVFNGVKPQARVDLVSYKKNIQLEKKIGAGWLTEEKFTHSEAEALAEKFRSGELLYTKHEVSYTPRFNTADFKKADGTVDIETATDYLLDHSYILTGAEFQAMLIQYNLIRVRHSSKMNYGVAIQQWITTEHWGSKKTRETEMEIREFLESHETFREYLNRH